MEQVYGVLVMILLGKLEFLVLIIVHHHLMLKIEKNNFLVLGEGRTDNSNDSVGAAEQKFSFNFSRAKRRVWFNSHYNHNNSYLFVEGKEI